MPKKNYLSRKDPKQGRAVSSAPVLSADATNPRTPDREEQSDVMTLEEAAQFLRTSRPSLLSGVKNGDVPHMKIGALYRFSRAALQEEMRNKMTLTNRPKIPIVDDGANHRRKGEEYYGDGARS